MIRPTPAARRRRRRRAPVGALVRIALTGLVFALGVALGEALHDNPRPGGPRTGVRTLAPLTLTGAPETVTVTVTSP